MNEKKNWPLRYVVSYREVALLFGVEVMENKTVADYVLNNNLSPFVDRVLVQVIFTEQKSINEANCIARGSKTTSNVTVDLQVDKRSEQNRYDDYLLNSNLKVF
jgi:hypothetical protein